MRRMCSGGAEGRGGRGAAQEDPAERELALGGAGPAGPWRRLPGSFACERGCGDGGGDRCGDGCGGGCGGGRQGWACYRPRPPAPHPGVSSCLSALTGLSRGCLGKGGQRSTPRTRQPGPPFGRQPSLWRTGALGVGPRGICRAAISRASPSRSTRAGPQSSLCSAPHLLRPPS